MLPIRRLEEEFYMSRGLQLIRRCAEKPKRVFICGVGGHSGEDRGVGRLLWKIKKHSQKHPEGNKIQRSARGSRAEDKT